MSQFLKDLSTQPPITSIEENNFEFWSHYGRARQAKLHNTPNKLWFATGIPNPLFNGILRVNFTADQIDAQIDETLLPFLSDQLPVMWMVGPATQPTDLGRHLEAHGLIHPFDIVGMAADLMALNEELSTPPGLTIVPVTDQAALKSWLQVACESFDVPRADFDAIFDLEVSLGIDQRVPWRRYLAYLDGRPVATSLVFLGSAVAGIYWVATAAEARNKGIGAAITLAPLREARALGYRTGILHATPMGLNVYRRLGFEEHCRIGLYMWDSAPGHHTEG